MVLSCFFKVLTKTAGNRKSKTGKRKHKLAKYPALPEEILRQYNLAEIKAATNNFDENLIIARAYGNVYKGIFNDGHLVIAVKRLRSYAIQDKEFQTEAILLSQLRHPHLVSLLGFCGEHDEVILVYEYMSNGSLDKYLHYMSEKDPLPWKKRLQICIDAARGLHYLHTGAKQAVIHCDIRSSNIFLDDNWDGKLCGFGISKLRSPNKAKSLKRKESGAVATFGYVDPEYLGGSELTEKCDVYSFGVVLFEVLCAREAFDKKLPKDQKDLAVWARKCIKGGAIYKIIDPYLMGKIAPECFKIFVEIAFCCVNEKGNRRSDMGEVELMLELALEMQEKADSDHMSPQVEYVLEHLSFAALAAEYPSNVDGFDEESDAD